MKNNKEAILFNLAAVCKQDSQLMYVQSLLPHVVNHLTDTRVFVLTSCRRDWNEIVKSHSDIELIHIPSWGQWPIIFLIVQILLPLIVWKKHITCVYSPNQIFPVLLGKKNIVTIHDLSHVLFKSRNFLIGSIMKFLYKQAFLHSKEVIVLSHSVAEEIKQMFRLGEQTGLKVVHSALPLEIVSTKESEDEIKIASPYVLYMGMYHKRKNIEFCIEGFSLFCKKFPESKLQFYLTGSVIDHQEKLLSDAQKLGVKDRIHFLGFLSSDQKQNILTGASALLFPSLYEGFGFPCLEAQRMGVPLITSNTSSLPEIAGDGAVFIDPKDKEALALGIEKILFDSNFRTELIKNGYKNLRRFSWEESGGEVAKSLLPIHRI